MLSWLTVLLGKELNIPQDMVGVHFVEPHTLTRLWQNANKIMSDSLKFKNEKDAAEYRRGSLINLYGELQQCLTPQLYLAEIDGTATPLLDEAALNVSERNIAISQLFLPEQNPTGTPWNLDYNSETLKLFESFATGAKHRQQVVVVGNDILLRNIASTYLCFLSTLPDRAELVDIVFYILPSPSCAVGTMLAEKDEWYSIHIVEALRYLMAVFPQLSAQFAKYATSERAAMLKRSTETFPRCSELCPKDYANPPSLISSVLDNYLVDAHCVLKVCCFCYGLSSFFFLFNFFV